MVWTAGDRKPAGTIFSAPVQTSPGPRLASYTVGTGSLFLVIARQGCDVNHPPPSSAEVKERVELYLCSPSGPTCRVLLSTVSYTCMHPHWQLLHPLCSWSGYGPAVIFHPQPKLPKSRILLRQSNEVPCHVNYLLLLEWLSYRQPGVVHCSMPGNTDGTNCWGVKCRSLIFKGRVFSSTKCCNISRRAGQGPAVVACTVGWDRPIDNEWGVGYRSLPAMLVHFH